METKQMYSNAERITDFSAWLNHQLCVQDLTIAQLSRLSGVHRNTIFNYMRKNCEPTMYTVHCLCKALGYEFVVVPK